MEEPFDEAIKAGPKRFRSTLVTAALIAGPSRRALVLGEGEKAVVV